MAGKRNRKKHKTEDKKPLPEESTPPQDKRTLTLKIVVRVLFTVLFFTYLFGLTLKYPLNDPDVWWHLRTGEFIIQHHEIPDDDYFSYTTPRPLTVEQIRGLRVQWLGQVVFALADRAGGITGVAMFRNLLIILPMLALFLWLIRNGLSHYAAAGIVTVPGTLLALQLFYAFERPQAFSFLLVLIAIMLLERLRSRDIGKFDFSMVALPALMALWSNLHAGFIVGNIVIFIYFGAELLRVLWQRLRGAPADAASPAFFAVCVVSVFASFINPNTYHVFLDYFVGLTRKFFRDFSQTLSGEAREGWVEQVVLEFKPLYYFYKVLHYKWITYYWIFTGVLFASLLVKYWVKRKLDLAELVTAAVIAFFANYYARGLMFSLTVLPFYLGKTALELRLPPLNYRRLCHALVAAMLAITVGFLTSTYRGHLYTMLKPKVSRYWVSPWYPLAASDFIEQVRPKGPMYNFYTWGGFLIWRLYPQYKVFIDGRAIDRDVSWTADSILKTMPEWRRQLDAYNINFILVPVVFRESGHIVPLGPALVGEDDWKLIFLRNNSAVFVRDVPQNRHLIASYNMDKRWVFREIINVENVLLMGMPNNPTYHLAKADALFSLGEYERAKEIYMRFPRESAEQLQMLRKLGH